MAGWWDFYAWTRRWTGRGVSGHGIELHEGRDLARDVDALADRLGGRRGLDAILDDLDREAVAVDVPATAADHGFRWADDDFDDTQWWPQGITTSADANATGVVRGRSVVVVSWYAKRVNGRTPGVRLSFVDVTDPQQPRYRHVLLVEPVRHWLTRRVTMRPVPVHAGGIVWYGPAILVADTVGGFRTFAVDDICRVAEGCRGYDYVLPQQTSYRAATDRGFRPFRFSFVSLDRSGPGHQLIAGEYGRTGGNRLVRFAMDGTRPAPALQGGAAHPLEIVLDGPPRMQGVALVDGTYYISTSRGNKPGTLWVRRPGEPDARHQGVLAVGPEDLAYWPGTDRLWNCSEYPGRRYVCAISRGRLDEPHDQPTGRHPDQTAGQQRPERSGGHPGDRSGDEH